MTDDELDALLTPKEQPPDNGRREAIFAKTLPHLRPWRFRRLAWPAVFAAGLAVGWFAKPTPPAERIVETVIEKEFVPVPQSPGEQLVQRPPDRLELDAEMATDPATSAKLFQQAGDAYLKANKLESAIRCYRQYLGDAGPDGQAVRVEDSWLLTSLKNSKRKDGDHANDGL
ncbi:hypothetical protein [Limnoglobus roseus]|uniref:Uncharacterized protein n=1 Tax=Limnoglobus roseus TaxID=2598579 RepID=A0A5C1AA57_9BACT|nr:hypothetical protein [Limnoglobus roseus]QEL16091.1 hypothetical protein PX52LOC_03030 [Limnoglobus roseus]